jgi:bifunctional non-homologous end joining protein LigD
MEGKERSKRRGRLSESAGSAAAPIDAAFAAASTGAASAAAPIDAASGADPAGAAAVGAVPGAVPARFPGFIEPCLATLSTRLPKGGAWIHEVKFDGYRAQAAVEDGRAVILTRRGYDWTQRFATIARALRALHAAAVLDGEVVVLDDRGVSDYHRLQEDLARGRTDRLVYYAFDALYLDGFDLRDVPLIERKRLLAELLRRAEQRQSRKGRGNEDSRIIRYSEHFEACATGAAPRPSAPTRRGPGPAFRSRRP